MPTSAESPFACANSSASSIGPGLPWSSIRAPITLRAWIALFVSPSLCASASPFPAHEIASSCLPAVPQWLPSTV
jgi:hypothetical protein